MKIVKLLICFSILLSCTPKDEEGRDIYNIRYRVDIVKDNPITVVYNSDYNIDSGKEKPVIIPIQEEDGLFWTATHLQNKRTHPYSIKVSYDDYKNPLGVRHGVYVYANDTFLLDSITVTDWKEDIILEGEIPLNF